MGLQIPSKLVWSNSNSWIAQIITQWIPDCTTSRSEGATWISYLLCFEIGMGIPGHSLDKPLFRTRFKHHRRVFFVSEKNCKKKQSRLMTKVVGTIVLKTPRANHPSIFNVCQYYCARYWHRLDVCPSVCLSVTCWYRVETAQPIIKLSSLSGSPMILVYWEPNFFPECQ